MGVEEMENSNEAIQLKDQESANVVLKGGLASVPKTMGVAASGLTMTTLTIQCKDFKTKISFDETNFKWASGPVWTLLESKSNAQYKNWAEAVKEEMEALFADYKKALLATSDF